MSLQRIVGLVFFVVGILLLVFGINATDKVTEHVVEGVSGHYTDTTMWYIIGGIILIIVGGGLAMVRRRP